MVVQAAEELIIPTAFFSFLAMKSLGKIGAAAQ
jgi:hypothetical protein